MKLTTIHGVKLAIVILCSAWSIGAQTTTNSANGSNERRVALNEAATANDANGASALEGTLRTTELNGSAESPVTNVRLIVKNTSGISYAFVSGVATFYDSAGVRCGEGIFKADALAADESFEADTPGIRIRCQATTWRLVATHLLPRMPPDPPRP